MEIDNIRIYNYKCIEKLNLKNLKPITILVGRNNTGKSAFLEAIALISTAKYGWFDSLENNLLESIVFSRGGVNYSDLMVKLDEPVATIKFSRNNQTHMIKITKDINEMDKEIKAKMLSGFNDYINTVFSDSLEYIKTSNDYYNNNKLFDDKIRRIYEESKNEILKLYSTFVGYLNYQTHEIQYAFIGGDKINTYSRTIIDKILGILGAPKSRFTFTMFQLDNFIQSTNNSKSNVIFLNEFSIEYLKQINKKLTETGSILNTIDFIKEQIEYFLDIREAENNFLVFIKGLDKPVPVQGMGEGFFIKLITLFAIATIDNGIIIMEEPENHLHPGYMYSIINQIVKTANQKRIQYFISTHSLEFIKFLLEENTELVNVIRMYRINDEAEIDYELLSGEEALSELKDLKMDLRGI